MRERKYNKKPMNNSVLKYHLKLVVVISLIINCSNAFAQKLDNTTQVQTEAYRGITRSYKKNLKAEAIDTVIKVPSIYYPTVPRQAQTIYSPDLVQPAKLKVIEPLQKLYRGYVKAGMGTATSPLFDVYYNAIRSRSNGWGVNLKHFSSLGGVKAYNYSGFSQNKANLFGKKLLSNAHVISGHLDYESNKVHHYGVLTADTILENDRIKQRFSSYGGGGAIKSFFSDSTKKVNHQGAFNYYYFDDFKDPDKYKFDYAKEHNFTISGEVSKYLNKELFALTAAVDYNHYTVDYNFQDCNCIQPTSVINGSKNESITSTIVRLEPTISTQGKFYKFKVGLGIYPEISDELNVHFYPIGELKFSLFDNIIIPYAGVTGRLARNSFRSLANENPFVLSDLALMNSSHKLELYGGIRGTWSSTMSFNVKVSNGQVNGLPLFLIDTTFSAFSNRFKVMYDTVTVTNFSGEIAYEKAERLKVFARADVYTYQTRTAPKAWNLPSYKFTVSGVYDLADKYIVRADAYVVGGRNAASPLAVQTITPVDGFYPIELNDYVDFNLGFEYRFTKRLSVFLNINNIFAQNYQIWQNYPSQTITVLGGLTFSF